MALLVDYQLGLPVKAAAATATEVAPLASMALAVDDQLRLPAEAAPTLLTRIAPGARGHTPGVAQSTRLSGTLRRFPGAPDTQNWGLDALPTHVHPVVDDKH